jgi:hypothetical protein
MASRAQRGQQPAERHRGQVVSHTPGRVRIRMDEDHRRQATLGQLERGLANRAGVSSVSTNARTGSVLVHYDRHNLSRDDLLAVLHDLGMIVLDVTGGDIVADASDQRVVGVQAEVGHSTTAVTVMDALTDLDRRLSRLTGGKLDVKLLFPLGLGGLALRQIATHGLGLAEVPGYVLLWYAFDAFYKLHQRRTAQLVEAAAEHVMLNHPEPDALTDDIMLVDETGD